MTPSEVAFWQKAAADLGLDIAAPVSMTIPDHGQVVFSALVRNFGTPRGMVVEAQFDLLRPHTSFLKDSGYGYSSGFGKSAEDYDRQTLIAVLKDWGWSGPPDETPAWLAAFDAWNT